MTARVLVPLVGATGEGAQLFEAIAGDIPPEPHPARLLPQISELFDFGLYGIGQTVREAVTRFVAARRQGLWLSRKNGRINPWNLRISDLQIGRLSDENARSAGLGLALAAICHAFGRDPGVVFATGEILLPSGPGALTVMIGPVDGLRGKLSLIGDYIVQHRQALEGKRLIVVLPAAAIDGRPLPEAEAATLERLSAEARAAATRLDFIFAGALDDVEAALGPFAMRELLTPARAAALAATLFAAALLGGALLALQRAPIVLAFEPVAAAATPRPDDAAPQRARYDLASDKLQMLGPCFDDQRQPIVLGGETLIIRVKARDALPFASHLRAPRLFIASVSRAADPVILDAEHFRSLVREPHDASTIDMTAAIPIEPIEDEVRLFVVATRDPSLEITALQEALRKTLQGLSGAAVLTTTTNFLADRIGAEIEYQFKVANDPHACPS
ncbi:MAG: hypothetical protein JO107_16900 [Hyphomicrobiales bacterium]|nr:hypothetical protein [Hyphomicrobiales bacterium]MBV8664767.1 hypothetical protein [Hyphomicrobiales bacterium]